MNKKNSVLVLCALMAIMSVTNIIIFQVVREDIPIWMTNAVNGVFFYGALIIFILCAISLILYLFVTLFCLVQYIRNKLVSSLLLTLVIAIGSVLTVAYKTPSEPLEQLLEVGIKYTSFVIPVAALLFAVNVAYSGKIASKEIIGASLNTAEVSAVLNKPVASPEENAKTDIHNVTSVSKEKDVSDIIRVPDYLTEQKTVDNDVEAMYAFMKTFTKKLKKSDGTVVTISAYDAWEKAKK